MKGLWTGGCLALAAAIFLSLALSSSAVPAPSRAAKFLLGHYECYAVRSEQGFDSRAVALKDQFGLRKAKVVAPESLCNPVRKNTTQIPRRDAHLFCYRISAGKMKSRDVDARNQFGPLKLRALAPYSLCLPSGKSLTDNPQAIPPRLDHYECYLVRPLGDYKRPSVALFDQFWRTKAAVVRVFSLCNPVSKNGGNIVNKNDHLVCYTIKTGGFNPVKVGVSNQFDKLRIVEVVAPRLLCLPSTKREVQPALPDLTVQIVPKLTNAHIPVSCPSGAGSCTTTVMYRVINLTALAVTTGFQVRVTADQGAPFVQAFASFPASGSQTFTHVFGPGGNCYDPDCTVSATVDTGNTVAESNEGNNSDTYTVRG